MLLLQTHALSVLYMLFYVIFVAIATIDGSKISSHLLDRTSMSKLLDCVQSQNTLSAHELKSFTKFIVNDQTIGLVADDFREELLPFCDILYVSEDKKSIHFQKHINTDCLHEKTKALDKVTRSLREKGAIRGWREELLPVSSSYSDEPAILIERAATPYFGIKAYGVHVNGYLKDKNTDNISHMWVGKRSATKSTYPGMYDHIAAGGLPYGVSIFENVIKECQEEASIPASIARNAQAVGAVSYNYKGKRSHYAKRDTLFCFDLEMPRDFCPVNSDGEVESFELKEIEWVLNKVIEGGSEGYKPNCCIVLIDFLIRHGILHPESPKYLELLASLRPSINT